MFSPASTAYLTVLNRGWMSDPKTPRTKPLAPTSEPLVLSPIVIAMWKPMAEAMGYPNTPIGWSDMLELINDPQAIASNLGNAAIIVLRDGTTTVALLGYLFWQNWQLTALSLITVPVLAVGVRQVQRRVQRVGTAAYHAQNRLAAVVDDLARAWRVIRTFDAGAFERARFDREAQQVQRMGMKNVAAAAMMTPISQLAASLGVAAIVTLALYQAQKFEDSIPEFQAAYKLMHEMSIAANQAKAATVVSYTGPSPELDALLPSVLDRAFRGEL